MKLSSHTRCLSPLQDWPVPADVLQYPIRKGARMSNEDEILFKLYQLRTKQLRCEQKQF